MKKFPVNDEKIFHVYKAFDCKNNSYEDMRISHPHLLETGFQHGEKDSKNKNLS